MKFKECPCGQKWIPHSEYNDLITYRCGSCGRVYKISKDYDDSLMETILFTLKDFMIEYWFFPYEEENFVEIFNKRGEYILRLYSLSLNPSIEKIQMLLLFS